MSEIKFSKRMSLKDKRKYIVENKIILHYSGIEYIPEKEDDLNCKICCKELKIRYSDKKNLFYLKSCFCAHNNDGQFLFKTIFGENSEDLYKKSKDYIRKCNRKGTLTKKWFIEKYGEEEGVEKYNSFISNSRQNLVSFIKRHGEEIGKKKYLEFIEKSKVTKENFIKRFGDREGITKWENHIADVAKKSRFSILYWIDRNNGNLEVAKEEYKKYQARNYEWYIKQYGEDIGEVKWNEKKEMHSWVNSRERYVEEFGEEIGLKKFIGIQIRKQENKGWITTSLIARKLFSKLDLLFNKDEKTLWQKEKNNLCEEFKISTEDCVYFYDFVVEKLRLCVEFNGSYWHMDPKKYEKYDINYNTKKIAKDIWEYDEKKKKTIEYLGYLVFVVWENEYKINPNKIFDEIKEIINKRRELYG